MLDEGFVCGVKAVIMFIGLKGESSVVREGLCLSCMMVSDGANNTTWLLIRLTKRNGAFS